MSGGSMSYIYSSVEEYCVGYMEDAEMNDLMKDLVEVLHDLEWWQSADTSEENYRQTLAKFKKKWFGSNREERLKGYIDKQIAETKSQLYQLIGRAE